MLARLAADEHPQLQIMPGDTVVLSATPIPGNEEMVNHIIDDLFRLGADVIYSDLSRCACVGARQPRGSQDDALAGAAALLHADAWRIPPSGPARAHGPGDGHPAENIVIIESGQVVEVRTGRASASASG